MSDIKPIEAEDCPHPTPLTQAEDEGGASLLCDYNKGICHALILCDPNSYD
jgi:hypothetical protein